MRRALAAVGVAGLALGLAPTVASPASAIQAPVAFTSVDLPTWQANGVAWSVASTQGLVFVGGDFTSVRPSGAPAGTGEVARRNFAVFDAATGNPTSCAPSFDVPASPSSASVRALRVSPDGNTLYVGGYFSHAGGVAQQHLAALNVATCTVRTDFRPLPSGTVRSVWPTSTRVYFGGALTNVGGTARTYAAAVSAVGTPTPGSLLSWAPQLDAEVRAVAVSPDESAVVVGGNFNTANGAASRALVVTNPTSGANLRAYGSTFIPSASSVKDIAVDSTGFYTGNEGMGGGVFDGRIALDWGTFDQRWRDTCLGATQAVVVHQGVLYAGHHAHNCYSMGEFPDGDRWHFTAQRTTDPTLLPWFPDTNEGIGEMIGPRDMAVGTKSGVDYMWAVGEFTSVNGHAQQSITRFGPSPDSPPTTPVSSVTSTSPGQVSVAWRQSLDTDNSVLTYRVFRDNGTTPIHTTTGESFFWKRRQLTFVDGQAPGSTHTYRVSVSDGVTTVNGPWRSVTVAGSSSAYADRVRADGANLHWRYDEPSDVFVSDSSGNDNNATLRGAATYQVTPAALVGDPSRAMTLGGVNTLAYSETRFPAPTAFTVETWIRTTTGSGGRIIGFGDKQTFPSGASFGDKLIYMRNDGRLVFGVRPGSSNITIQSAASYNDGNWHHVAARQGSGGMALYVDGARVASGSTTTNNDEEGWWRLGGDNLGGWPNRPSSDYFAGTVDETAIYPTALSRATLLDHIALAGRSPASGAAGPADFYGRTVADSDPYLYWRLGETSGSTAADASGNGRTGTYLAGVTRNRPSAVVGTTNPAVETNGTSTGRIVSSTSASSPSSFTADVWFRTATTSGGKILGYGNSQSGTSSSADKHVYMRNDGRLMFGVSPSGNKTTVTSASAYNDNAWHHLAAVQGSSGMRLYVDGVQVGTSSQAGNQAYTGYWRLGGDNLNGWPNRPSSDNFAGQLDEFSVRTSAMTATQVAARASAGRGSAPDVAAPTTPSPVSAALAGGDVTLSWPASIDNVGVVEYQVHRSATSGFTPSGLTLRSTVGGTTATDPAPSGTWFYRVVAVDGAGNASVSSAQVSVSVTDTAPPSQPADLSAEANGTAVSLSWTGSTDDVGVVGYDVHRGTSAGFSPSPANLVGSTATTDFIHAPAPVGTSFYRVVARDGAGNLSAPSSAVLVGVTDAGPPTAPTGLTATVQDAEVSLAWLAATDDTGVVGYDVHRSATPAFIPAEGNRVGTPSGTAFADTVPSSGTWYYQVIARDGAGNAGPPSGEVSAIVVPFSTTVTVDPTADTYGNQGAVNTNYGSTASLVSRGNIGAVSYLRFPLPAAPSGSVLTSASLRLRTTSDSFAGSAEPHVVNSASNSWTESTLTWNLRPAISGAALGTLPGGTAPSTAYTIGLSAPELSTMLGGDATLTVSNAGVDNLWFSSRESATSTNRPQLVLGFTPADSLAPSAPTEVTANGVGAGAEVAWTASSDDVGVVAYDVHRGSSADFTPSESTLMGTTNLTTWTESVVTPGSWYYRVIARDGAGNSSDASDSASVVVSDVTAPSAPTGLAADPGDHAVDLDWTAATDDVAVDHYEVHRSTTADFVVDETTLLDTVASPGYLDEPVDVGSWHYRVLAVDAAGNRGPTTAALAVAVVDVVAPSQPQALSALTAGADVSLTWTASTDDEGVIEYEVHRAASADFTPGPLTLRGTTAETAFVESGVTPGTWHYRVVARDAAGNASTASDSASAEAADVTDPLPPTGVAGVVAGAEVALSWTAAVDDGVVVGYDVYRSATSDFDPQPSDLVATVTGTQHLDAPVGLGDWYYRVVAEDAAGNRSAPSPATLVQVTDIVPPDAPDGLSAVAGDEQVSLSWNAAGDDVGVTSYEVHRSATSGFVPGSATLVGTNPDTDFIDQPVAAGTWYYRVLGRDAGGNRGAASDQVEVTVEVIDDLPSIPTELVTSVTGETVTLGWTPSTDDVSVTGYRVHRGATDDFAPDDGNLIGSPSTAGYADVGAPAGTWFYRVVAVDSAGQRSAPSLAAQATVVLEPVVIALAPVADTYANQGAAATNYGTTSSLAARDGAPSAYASYLRFDLPVAPPGRTLVSAALAVRTTNETFAGSAGAPEVRLGAEGWTESTLTWANRPSIGSDLLGTFPAGSLPGTVYSASLDPSDLAPLVGGVTTLALTVPGDDSFWFWSRQQQTVAFRPALTLTYA